MKVLTFTPLYLPSPGGIEIFVDSLAQSLRGRAIETVVVTDSSGRGSPFEVLNGVAVHRLDLTGAIQSRDTTAPLRVLHQLMKIYEAEKADIIHMHSATQASAWYVARLFRKLSLTAPFIVTQHGVLEPVDRLNVVRELILKADVLTAVSNAALQSAIEFAGRTSSAAVIYNGVPRFDDLTAGHQPPAPHRLICVGRLQREKGFDCAIEALARVRAAGLDAQLSIIGQGGERLRLEELAAGLGLANHLFFAGVLDHVSTRKAIADASLLLAPSRTREGFSLVVVEAALAGVPVVASRVGGLPETVEEGVSGLLVSPDNADELASAIVRLLRDDKTWRTFSENARRRAIEKFDMDLCAANYAALYSSCRSSEHRTS
jgi:glycogen(starch) synthase